MTRFIRRSRLHLLVAIAVLVATVTPLLSTAQPLTADLTITNNTSRAIRHVYLAPAAADSDWGPDQLNNSSIVTGGTHTLSISCGSEVKVIAEDDEGCFYYQVVSCSESSSWTIDNNSARDCGGN